MAKRTYIDACVLIAAMEGKEEEPAHQHALAVLADPERLFLSSRYVRLEVIPRTKPAIRKLYERFFQDVEEFAPINDQTVEEAEELMGKHGLSVLDALHAACALTLRADELVTKEKSQKPLHHVSGLTTSTIDAPSGKPDKS